MSAFAEFSSLPRDPPVWRLPGPVDEGWVSALRDSLGVHPLLARLLVNRGIETEEEAREVLEPDLSRLHDPFAMTDMRRAVERVARAVTSREEVVVYGDYDVDGVTSTALLVSFLQACGAHVTPYIPKRLVQGYGLSTEAVEELASRGFDLLMACDCGVTAVEEVDRATALGLDVVIVDHHRARGRLPSAVAVLDPHREDCGYPFRHLAAVGVTFKLLMALRKHLREIGHLSGTGRPEPNLRELLDIVALGTVSDVVPLVDENRTLVAVGLKVLAEDRRVGLRALKAVSGIEAGSISAGQLAFRLGPRINAAGRLDDARAGLELILCEDPFEAAKLANALDAANAERREIEQRILEQALAQASRQDPTEPGLVLSAPGWHPGVVGIVASRVAERLRRPTLVLGKEGDVLQGSGRSIGEFHLHDALVACAEHLVRFGGHRAAAGLELEAANLGRFRDAFLAYCGAHVKDADVRRTLRTDGEMDPSAVDGAVCEAVEALAPFGAGNPTPTFIARNVRLDSCRIVGRPSSDGSRHLKCEIAGVDAIGFGIVPPGELAGGGTVDIAYTCGFNSFRGERRPQIVLEAVLPAGTAAVSQ